MIHTPMTGAIDVFCVGDSLTYGTTNTNFPQPPDNQKQAYRLALSNALQADIAGGEIPGSVSFSWVGPTDTGSPPSNHNAGVPGDTTGQTFIRLLTSAAYVTAAQVVVVAPVGVNDSNSPALIATFPESYLSVIRRAHNLLRAKRPRFILSSFYAGSDPDIAALNAALPALWAELERNRIEFETMSWAGVGDISAHPTQAQYDLLGASDVPGDCYHVAFRSLIGYPMA